MKIGLRLGFGFAIVLVGCGSALCSAAPVACTRFDQDAAESARATARQALKLVVAELIKKSSASNVALSKWFGNSTAQTRAHVVEVLSRTSSWLDSVNFKCLYSNQGEWKEQVGTQVVDFAGSGFAYVDRTDLDTIFLGLLFHDAPATGHDSKFGTIIHEMTHFWMSGSVSDKENHYGRVKSAQLALANPAAALDHADAYQYLTEDLSGL